MDTYKVYKRSRLILDRKNYPCFREFFEMLRDNSKWTRVIVKVVANGESKPLKDFWLNFVKEIEPSMQIIKEDNEEWIELKPSIEKGKIKVVLTLLRFMWEYNSPDNDLPSRANKILKEYPDMDKMQVAFVACIQREEPNSNHSLFSGCVPKLPTVEDYKNFKGSTVYEFSKCDEISKDIAYNLERQLKGKDFKYIIDYFKNKKEDSLKKNVVKESNKKSLKV